MSRSSKIGIPIIYVLINFFYIYVGISKKKSPYPTTTYTNINEILKKK